VGNLLLVAAGAVLSDWRNTDLWAAAAAAMVGVLTFFGVLGLHDESALAKERIRDAIASAFIVVYLVLLGLLAFQSVSGEGFETPEVANTLVTNFTVLMGVVIAAYFGATTYEKVKGVAGEGSQGTAAGDSQASASGVAAGRPSRSPAARSSRRKTDDALHHSSPQPRHSSTQETSRSQEGL
jgi:hypothetical protein